MRLEVILQVLEARQATIAREAMEQPAAEPFGHGRSVGLYAGLTLAKDALVEFYNEMENRKNKF